jgi:hypothetical protein
MAALPDWPHTDHLPYPRMVEYDVGESPLRDHLLVHPLRPVNGQIAVPEAPGLGIEFDLMRSGATGWSKRPEFRVGPYRPAWAGMRSCRTTLWLLALAAVSGYRRRLDR